MSAAVVRREALAALAHEQWSGWMRYLVGRSRALSGGGVLIPAELAARWRRQMATAYAQLPEEEKASDRAEADRVLDLLGLD